MLRWLLQRGQMWLAAHVEQGKYLRKLYDDERKEQFELAIFRSPGFKALEARLAAVENRTDQNDAIQG